MKHLSLKQQLYNQCFDFIESRLFTIQNTISEIQESLTRETKSSAGDKHETGRAMLQLEREKLGVQLAEIIKVKEALSKINTEKKSQKISLGSVVYTTQNNYYLGISAGELVVKDHVFYAISPSTPIGKLLFGKMEDDVIVFSAQTFKIIRVI